MNRNQSPELRVLNVCRPAAAGDQSTLGERLSPLSVTRVICVLLGWLLCARAMPDDSNPVTTDAQSQDAPQVSRETRRLYSGRVVLLQDALKRRGLRVADEMAEQAVLETGDGELLPLLADWRGRAFFQDPRLRDRRVELVAYRRPQLPYLQVLMVFTFDDEGTRMYTDYWCDVCSIPMYEIKPCECCQGDIRLRFQVQDLPAYLPDQEAGRD